MNIVWALLVDRPELGSQLCHTSCNTSGKSLMFLKPQFPHLQNGDENVCPRAKHTTGIQQTLAIIYIQF